MNKETLLERIKEFILTKNSIDGLSEDLSSITTNLQNAKKNEIVFYKINSNEKSFDLFHSRLEKSSPGLIILNQGAEAVKIPNSVFINEDKFLIVQKLLCDEFYPNKNTIKMVGVTGTNGKTTTVNLGMQISTLLKHPAISVGTIGVFDINGEVKSDLESTTPSYVEIRKLIHRFQDQYHAMFMEVSSHALDQNRLYDLKLDQAAWTSFSQDHLDYHRTMEEYFQAKLKIERKYLKEPNKLLLPPDEVEMNERIMKVSPNTRYKIVRTFEELKIKNYPLFYRSSYNQSNTELAIALNEELWSCDLSGFDLNKIVTPKGRFSVIEIGETSMAIIDYAHTPDALLNIGKAIKEAFPSHRLIVAFGCGGNRDKTKRQLMGKAVSSFADKIMVTSDNPRDEAPEDIIVDIVPGITINYEAMVDRKQAIITCLDDMEEGEILLIAGKGHEEYQEIKGVKHPFSDFDIVLKYKQEMEL